MSRFWWWAGYALIAVAVVAGVGGLLATYFVSWTDAPHWRWLTWLGLVAFTAYTVFGWWRLAPPPTVPPNSAGQTTPNVTTPTTVPAETEEEAKAKAEAAEKAKAEREAAARANTSPLTRLLTQYAEPFFTWLVSYPLFPLPFVFFWLVSWAGLGDGLGFPDIVWDEDGRFRLWAGFAVGMLFGVLLIVRYLLDDRRGSEPTELFGEKPSLFWFVKARRPIPKGQKDGHEKIRRMGAFLFWVWPLTLAVFYVPKIGTEAWRTLPADGMMGLGLVAAVAANVVLVFLYDRALRLAWFERAVCEVVAFMPGFRAPKPFNIPEEDRELHGLMGVLTALPTVFLVVFLVDSGVYGTVWSPVWLVCLLVGLFTLVYGFVTFQLGGLQYVLVVLLGLILVVCNTKNPYRMSFPGWRSTGRARSTARSTLTVSSACSRGRGRRTTRT